MPRIKWQENEQGVFKEPYGIPHSIKEPVIYMRWKTGGMTGGSYSENSHLESYTCDGLEPKFKVLDLVLEELKPNLTFLQFREVEDLVHTQDWSDREDYYGNCTDYKIEYVILSELIKYLETL